MLGELLSWFVVSMLGELLSWFVVVIKVSLGSCDGI